MRDFSQRRGPLAVSALLAVGLVGLVAAPSTSAQSGVPHPLTASQPIGNLYGVAAISSGDVWVVGSRPRDHHREFAASASHWNGHSWREHYLDRTTYSGLEGIDALAPDDIWAVGSRRPKSSNQPLIEHWDGSAWTSFATSNPPKSGYLNAVAALSSGNAWAVGSAGRYALIEHWNGVTWRPVVNQVRGVLYAVSGSAGNDVWGVGARYDQGYWRPIAEHYDGHTWTRDRSFLDVAPRGTTSPSGVVDIAPDDVWAVGYSQKPMGGGLRMLIEHWDGSAWTVVPGPPLHDGSLDAVSGTSADDIWAVGEHHLYYGLAIHWDGKEWSSSYAGHRLDAMADVSADTPSEAWAVSNIEDFGSVDHWTGSHWHLG